MKAEFLKIAGVKSEAEFYKKFPSEEAFMKKHGKAVKSLMAKKAQVGAMIPNKVAPMQNPLPVRVTQDTLYDEAALRTGRKTVAEMKDEAMYEAQMDKLKEKPKPSLLEQLMNPLGGSGDTSIDMGNLFGGDDSAAPSTSGGEEWGLSFPEGLQMEGIVNRNGGKINKAQDGKKLTKKEKDYYKYKEEFLKAARAIGKNEGLEDTSLTPLDTPYSSNELRSDYNYLNQLRKDAGLGVGEHASYMFPYVGQQMRGTVNQMLGTNFNQGGKVKKAQGGVQAPPSINPTWDTSNLNIEAGEAYSSPTNQFLGIQSGGQSGESQFDSILGSKAVKIGAPIVSDIYQISQQLEAQKNALQSARQATAVAEIASQAAGTMPEQIERKYVRPEDVQNTGEEFFPIYGVGTNVLSRNGGVYKAQKGGMFSDAGYVPLVNYNKQKAFGQGGVLGSNSYLVPKGQDGIMYGGGTAGNFGMQAGQAMGFTDAGSQIGGKIGGTIGSAFGPIGSAVGSFIGSGIGDLLDRNDRRTAIEERKAKKANLELASASVAPAIQAGYASHVRNGGKIPSNPSMLDTMAMGGDVKTLWGGKVETASYNPYAGGESIEFKGNSHDYRDPKTGETGIGVAYGEDSVATNTPVVEVENEPAQKLGSGGESENLVVYGDLKIPEEYIAEIGDDRAKGKKFKSYVSDILNKDEAKINKKMEKAAEKGLEAGNTKWDKLEIATANAIVDGGDMKLKSIADKKMILADLQSALNDTFDEYAVKGNEFISKNKIVKDPEKMMEVAKDGKKVPKAQGEGQQNTPPNGDFNRQLGGSNNIPTTNKSPEELIKEGYKQDPNNPKRFTKQTEDGVEAVEVSVEALGEVPEGQSRDEDTGLFGGVTMEQFEAAKEANSWFDWENFDPSSEADVERYQREFNKRAKEAGSDKRIEVDGDFGVQTTSARFTPGAPGQEPKVEVVETTTETTTATPQGSTPIMGGLRGAGMFDVPLDANDFLAEQYAMATNQVQPVYAQTFQPQLRVPYDISLQDAKNDIIAQSRAAQRNPAAQNNPALAALMQAPTYEALNKINAEEFRRNQVMKDTVYSGNLDTLNKARLMNLGVYDQQQDRLADAASKTRTQNIDILKSISDKYAKNRLENKLARVYQNLYPSYRYDKDGNLVPVGGAVFNVNGQMIGSPGFMPGTGVIPTAQNILTGVGMAQQLGIGDLFKRKPREETVASEITPMASVVANPLEEVLLRQAGKIPQQSTGNWWEEETTSERIGPYAPIIPQGKKGKTVKKNNKNSNILRALKNL